MYVNLHEIDVVPDWFAARAALGTGRTGPTWSMIRPTLREAVKRREFYYEYQPIVATSDCSLLGYEALVRWRHGGGTVLPADFIWIAEQTGTIADIQRCALSGVSEALVVTDPALTFAINWSPSQLNRCEEIARFIELVHSLGIAASRLTIEITEGSLLNLSAATLGNICRLKQAGFAIALDDFGTGYCGLGYLKDLPVERLKIDQSFVRDMVASPKARTIVAAIVDLAHGLGISVVAEGVETVPQLEMLRAMQCDYVQGFLLGRPSAWISGVSTIAACHPPAESLQ